MELAPLILEAIRFEHWLRFHFLDLPGQEDDPFAPVLLHVPEHVAQTCLSSKPDLAPLLLALNQRPITLEDSRRAVFDHVAARLGQKPDDPDLGRRLMALVQDPDFRRQLDAFHTWVQELAEAQPQATAPAPEAFTDFQEWQARFFDWAAAQQQHVTSIPVFRP